MNTKGQLCRYYWASSSDIFNNRLTPPRSSHAIFVTETTSNAEHIAVASISRRPTRSVALSTLASADGPLVTPAHVAVSHSQTTDALGTLQLITLVAGEMHCGSSPVVGGDTHSKTLRLLLKFPSQYSRHGGAFFVLTESLSLFFCPDLGCQGPDTCCVLVPHPFVILHSNHAQG